MSLKGFDPEPHYQVARRMDASTPVIVQLPPTPEMIAAFEHGFRRQLRVRHKTRFKQPDNLKQDERASAEEMGLRAMLSACPK